MTKDIGKILRDKREELDLSVEEASNRTKIQIGFLNSIENNDRTTVPAAYFDLFLNKYAKFLDVEVEPKKKITNKKGSSKKKTIAKETKENQIEHKLVVFMKDFILFIQVNKKLSLVIFLFFTIFFLVKITDSIFNTSIKSDTNEPVVTIITIEGSSDDKLNFDIRDSILIEDDKPEFMIVKISAVAYCYVCY